MFPIIHAFFGDSPNANLAAEIAVFREQCYQKRDLLRGRHSGLPAREVRSYTPSRTAADTKASPAQR